MVSMNSSMLPHHKRRELCTTRPAYRDGRKPTAVKVYAVHDESMYLLIHGVPRINIGSELASLCSKYGTLTGCQLIEDYNEKEDFTNVYTVKYQNINNARHAKRALDDLSFYGGVLHVCYAPEYETIEETRFKLQERRKAVSIRLRKINAEKEEIQSLKEKGMKKYCKPIQPDDQQTSVTDVPHTASYNPSDTTQSTQIIDEESQANSYVYPSMSTDGFLGGDISTVVEDVISIKVSDTHQPNPPPAISQKRSIHPAVEAASWQNVYKKSTSSMTVDNSNTPSLLTQVMPNQEIRIPAEEMLPANVIDLETFISSHATQPALTKNRTEIIIRDRPVNEAKKMKFKFRDNPKT